MINKIIIQLKYYLWATYRRRSIDKILFNNLHYYNGIVLDIGGRSRGKFKKPEENIIKWIYADIDLNNKPDIVLDVSKMTTIENESIDSINAIELFEHVKYPLKGLAECYRTLKFDGFLVISSPFLFQIHADPCDYQRWTIHKWNYELSYAGFSIDKLIHNGFFFTVLGDMIKALIKTFPIGIRQAFFTIYPLIDLMVMLDKLDIVKNNSVLNKFTSGYIFYAKKIQAKEI
jgi:SAM-dependent methyltransferase